MRGIAASLVAHTSPTLAAPQHEPSEPCTQLIIDGPFAETKEILVG